MSWQVINPTPFSRGSFPHLEDIMIFVGWHTGVAVYGTD